MTAADPGAWPAISPVDAVAAIDRLAPGKLLTLIGLDRDAVGLLLRMEGRSGRGALLVGGGPAATAESVADRVLDDLAAILLQRWPSWYGAADRQAVVDGAVGERAISRPWLKAAVKRAEAGQPPRFRRAAKGFELAQLLRATDPSGLLLIADVDPASPARAAPLIQVLEWCAGGGAAAVAALAVAPPPDAPYDRILYGARAVRRPPAPALDRFIAPRAHYGSPIEARVAAALRRDPELGPLFACNALVALHDLGTPPRVDLLWREGRVVVELDGPDHQADVKFADDRHRDFRLLVAGYRVLRLTNGQVDTDLARCIEKIRAVVRFRRAEGGPFA